MRPAMASHSRRGLSVGGGEETRSSRLRRVVETHDKQLSKLNQEFAALRDCLEETGFLSTERFLSRAHSRKFSAVLRAHPIRWDAFLLDVLQAQGIVDTIAAGAGLPTTRALRTANRAVCQAAAIIAADLGVAYGTSCAVCVLGGFNGAQCLSYAELFDPNSGNWQALPPMPERRAGPAGAVLGGNAYVCGGSNDLQCLSSVERLDLIAGVWETMPAMTDRRDGASSVALESKVYVFGGYNGLRFLSSAERFDPERRIWETLPQMSERRYRGAAAVLGGMIYVLGGSDDLRCLSSAARFDPAVCTWESLPAMEVRRDGAAVVSFAGRLYVLGGNDGMQYLNSVEMFDPVMMRWEQLRPMQERRYRAAAAVLRGQVYVFGGYDGRVYLSSTERFDPKAGHNAYWETAPPMRIRRAWMFAVSLHRWGFSGQQAARYGRLGLQVEGFRNIIHDNHNTLDPHQLQTNMAWS